MLLTVSCSYAMESLPTTPTGDNNIKQTVEDVKQTPTDNKPDNLNKDAVNDLTDDFSILNIDKTVQQLNNVNTQDNNNKSENKSSKKNINSNINKDWRKMSGLEREQYFAQRTNNLTNTQKKLLKVELNNRFSKSCQNFVQNTFRTGNANFDPKRKFYNAVIAEFGVMIGLKLEQIFSDVLKSEIKLNNYDKYPNFASVKQQLQKVYQHLILVRNQYQYILQKRGYVDKF